MLLVVALATQVVWVLVRYAGEEVFGRSRYLVGLEFGMWFAASLVAALAMFELASRLASARTIGALIAAVAFTVGAGCMIGVDIGWRGGYDEWINWMYVYGWRALDMIAIAGLAIAGTRRAMWVAAPAIGLALIDHSPAAFDQGAQLWYAAIRGLQLVLLFVLVQEAERFATHETSYVRVARGFRIYEVALWMSVGLALCHMIPAFESPSSVVALIMGVLLTALRLVAASGVWLVLRSRIVEVPQWPFALALVTLVWQSARTARSWTVTLATKWDRFESVKITHVPWWVYIPTTLGTLCVAGSLFVLARRLQVSTRASLVAIVLILACSALAASAIAPSWTLWAASAGADLCLVLAMRAGRKDIYLVHERATHAHTFA